MVQRCVLLHGKIILLQHAEAVFWRLCSRRFRNKTDHYIMYVHNIAMFSFSLFTNKRR